MRGSPFTADYEVVRGPQGYRLEARGDWVAAALNQVDGRLRAFAAKSLGSELVIDVADVGRMDTAGAMVLQRTMSACETRTDASHFTGADPIKTELLQQAGGNLTPCEVREHRGYGLILVLDRMGRALVDRYFVALELLGFLGLVLGVYGRLLKQPSRMRITPTIHHMEDTGLDAVPIVALLCFLIGAVVAFMGARVLQAFGAEIFTVEMVGIAVLREFGVMLTAILLAGRSGSAFTAQIGSMKNREEIDAMRSLGLDPIELLVIPRVTALILMTPILTFVGMIMGLIGGAVVIWAALDYSPSLFAARMTEMVGINNFWGGMIKAPFFAFVIAIIGCHQGLKVEGSAEAVGRRTTISVVQAIFFVIVIDAFFAMFYLEIDF